jgi:nucleoside-diphosphate-sugar epimerase
MSKRGTFLITGAQGLLGSHLIKLISAELPGCKLVLVQRSKGKGHRKNSSNIKIFHGDLREAKLWNDLPNSITHVFHLAAYIPWNAEEKNKARVVEDNLIPLAHLIEQSQKWLPLEQVIFSSSISVYSRSPAYLKEFSPKEPLDLYGASKLAGEQLLLCLGIRGVKVVNLRYSSLYAYGQYPGSVLPIMIDRAITNKEILVYGTGKRTQDFLHYSDAARANILAYQAKVNGIFNIGSGVPISMTELAEKISKVFTGGAAKIIHVKEKEDNDPGFKLDISKAKKVLKFRPTVKLEAGLQMIKEKMEKAR